MISVWNDVRFGIRSLFRAPYMTCVAASVMGTGVGAAIVVYVVTVRLLFPSLPVPEPSRLRFLYGFEQSDPRYDGSLSLPELAVIREFGQPLFQIAGYRTERMKLVVGLAAFPIVGESVTESYFDVISEAPVLGRGLLRTDALPGSPAVIVISDALWRTHFDGDRTVLGRVIHLFPAGRHVGFYDPKAEPYTVVGVMRPEFTGTVGTWTPASFWIPVEKVPAALASDSHAQWTGHTVLRMSDSTSDRQLDSVLDAASAALQARYNISQERTLVFQKSPHVESPFHASRQIRPELVSLASGLVAGALLLVAAANVSGLLLGKLVQRQSEFAVKLAIGATYRRLAISLVLETVLRSLLTCAVAVALARIILTGALISIQRTSAAMGVTIAADDRVRINAGALWFGLTLSLSVGACVALVHWWQVSRSGIQQMLAASAATVSKKSGLLTRVMLILQIGVSCALLTCAAALAQDLLSIEFGAQGYDASHVFAFDMEAPEPNTQNDLARAIEFRNIAARQLVKALRDKPEVANVSVADRPPQFPLGTWIRLKAPVETSPFKWIPRISASPELRETFSIPILLGRDFNANEWTDQPRVAIVSRSLADSLWPGKDPLKEMLALQRPDDVSSPRWLEVIGVVADVRGASSEVLPVLYIPSPPYFSSLLVRFRSAANERLIDSVHQVISQISPSLIVTRTRQVAADISAARYAKRSAALVVGSASLFGMMLGIVGLYGALQYSVWMRRKELGTRMALGALPHDISRLVVTDGLTICLAGAVLGLGASRVLLNLVVTLVGSQVPSSWSNAALALGVVLMTGALASYLPAARAARIEPNSVLRYE